MSQRRFPKVGMMRTDKETANTQQGFYACISLITERQDAVKKVSKGAH